MSAVALHLSFTLLHPHSTKPNYPIFRSRSPSTKITLGLVVSSHSSISGNGQGAFDPELRPVLELATDSELFELERILLAPVEVKFLCFPYILSNQMVVQLS
ncbi:uncharacterized protein LOC117904024 [Vitis riparia]|uniref:uncharacterized protein LOC117904024 n=1 Tax=Vitis riparia TaxID=96939 RepID=UPI00155B2F13|nr:uncharacterized protein LOC117904024 [Vitis riparia]